MKGCKRNGWKGKDNFIVLSQQHLFAYCTLKINKIKSYRAVSTNASSPSLAKCVKTESSSVDCCIVLAARCVTVTVAWLAFCAVSRCASTPRLLVVQRTAVFTRQTTGVVLAVALRTLLQE